MASHNMKVVAITSLVFLLLASNGFVRRGKAAGECGKTPVQAAAASLSLCLGASSSARAKVLALCCSKVAALIKTAPKCLCAVILSPMARKAGLKPGIAVTIPKRCNINNRPAGKKCGRYIVP